MPKRLKFKDLRIGDVVHMNTVMSDKGQVDHWGVITSISYVTSKEIKFIYTKIDKQTRTRHLGYEWHMNPDRYLHSYNWSYMDKATFGVLYGQ